MKLKKKKSKGVTPETKKAFALTSLIGALLMGNNTGEIRLVMLHRQINAAMRVFNVKAGAKMYHTISAEVREMWVALAETYETSVTLDELPVVVELMSMLITPKDHKSYLGIAPYVSKGVANYDEVVSRICHAVLDLDRRLNEAYGTKPCSFPLSSRPITSCKDKKAKGERCADDTTSSRSGAEQNKTKRLSGRALRQFQKNKERRERKREGLMRIRDIAQKAREKMERGQEHGG